MKKTFEQLILRREQAVIEMKKNKNTKRFNKRLIERLDLQIRLAKGTWFEEYFIGKVSS